MQSGRSLLVNAINVHHVPEIERARTAFALLDRRPNRASERAELILILIGSRAAGYVDSHPQDREGAGPRGVPPNAARPADE
jgi:hypothetical protein